MGRINRGIIGAVSGKVGTVVGSTWRGHDIIKSCPLNVAHPVTALRTAESSRMKNMQALYNVIKHQLPASFGDFAVKKMSGYNMFVKNNKSLFNQAIPLPYTDFIMTRGLITPTPVTSVIAVYGDSSITVNWNSALLDSTQASTDRVYILVCNLFTLEFIFSDIYGVVQRSVNHTTLATGTWLNDFTELYVYLCFKRTDELALSDTTIYKKVPTFP
jgi:hypothetical protein